MDIRDLLHNSMCITRYNYDLVNENKEYLSFLKYYNRIYITDEVCFKNMNSFKDNELFFLKDKLNKEWIHELYYIFSFAIGEKDNQLYLIDLKIRTKNFKEEFYVKFDLTQLSLDLNDKKINKKDDLINIFIDNLFIIEKNNIFHYNGDYALNLIAKNDYSIDVFGSLILSSYTPLAVGIVYIDKDLANKFNIFLQEFFNLFLEAPLKN